MNTAVKRMNKPTPGFFKTIRNLSVVPAGVSTLIVTAPIAVSAVPIKAAGYLAVAGIAAGTVSETAVKNEKR
ncbi:MAG: hypothetical protein ACM3H8_08530 [Sphingobacteriales bacterium]